MTKDLPDVPAGPEPDPMRRPTALSAKLRTAYNRLRGVPVETDLARYARLVRAIREAHAGGKLAAIADAEIGRRAAAPRRRPPDGPAAPPARDEESARVAIFALALEAVRRGTGLDAHDVQLVAGLAMAEGRHRDAQRGPRRSQGGRRRSARSQVPARRHTCQCLRARSCLGR